MSVVFDAHSELPIMSSRANVALFRQENIHSKGSGRRMLESRQVARASSQVAGVFESGFLVSGGALTVKLDGSLDD